MNARERNRRGSFSPQTQPPGNRDDLFRRVLEVIEDYARETEETGDTQPGETGDTQPSREPRAASTLEALLRDLATYQQAHVPPYARLCARPGPLTSNDAAWPPALPTDVFRYSRVASHPPSEDTHVFRTSGTTAGARGAHAFRDLRLYDAAARAHARHMLFPDVDRIRLVVLAEHPSNVPESSLSYMLGRFESWFGAGAAVWCLHGSTIDTGALSRALESAIADDAPVALLGTSFAFVFAEDALGDQRFTLPKASRIMQTGGYKGRSREIAPATLRQTLATRYGVEESSIIAEYGMTEMSSQLYEAALRDRLEGRSQPRRHLVPPPWVRVTPVHPETLAPVEPGTSGILRVDDAANLDSVAAILTSDLATACPDTRTGVALHGRASDAALRGCSLSVEEALGYTHSSAAESGDTHQ